MTIQSQSAVAVQSEQPDPVQAVRYAPEPQTNPLPAASPVVLLVTTQRWFSAARVAMSFHNAGARVELLSPSHHPALLTSSIAAYHNFHALRPLHSILAAVRASAPAIIIPADDTSANYLHQLHRKAHRIDAASAPAVRSLLARSLGDPASFPVLESRTALLAAAREQGILTPPTQLVPDLPTLRHWLSRYSLPAVLKADGTSGGEGVEIVTTKPQAIRAWRRLHAPLGLVRAAKKAGIDHDANHLLPWITHRTRQVSIQPFIPGHDANLAVACWQGQVLGVVALDVLHTWRPKGPAALVELTHNNSMVAAAAILVRSLNLSGLCGFDFIIEEPDATSPSAPLRPWLIEVNARATQTCHLPYGSPRDLISSLVAALGNQPLPMADHTRRRGIIALFPLAWQAGLSQHALDSCLQDIPRDQPALVQAGFAQPRESLYERLFKIRGESGAAKPRPGVGK